MISESIQHLLLGLFSPVVDLPTKHYNTTAFLVTSFALLVSWRIWSFTIVPLLQPHAPRELPYWIPCHAAAFFKNSNTAMTYGREYFLNTRKPFIITVAGQKLCIVTSPQDILAVYRNTTTLVFDTFVRDLLRDFGISSSGVQKMFESPEKVRRGSTELPALPPLDCIGVHGRTFSKQGLQPGEFLDRVQDRMTRSYSHCLEWYNLPSSCTVHTSQRSRTMSLMGWCQKAVLVTGAYAFFGDDLLRVSPDLFENYIEFDEHSWMLFYKYPAIFAKHMSVPKEKLIKTFTTFSGLSRKQRAAQAWYLRALEDEQRILGMTDRDIAITLLTSFNVISANPYKLCFWMLAYILFDQSLYNRLCIEVELAFKDNKLAVDRLVNECAQLQAVFDEVLRLKTASTSIRMVLSPTTINGTVLQAGTKVMLPYRQLHTDPTVFGENVAGFDSGRFLRDRTLVKSPSYRPFGGGSTLCPGRFIARSQVTGFVAMVLHRFDIQLASNGGRTAGKGSGQKFPRMEEGKPSLGVMGPSNGDDLLVTLKLRD